MKQKKLLISLLFLTLLAGCIPWPHTTELSPEIRGRVLDARTHNPIQGAKVFLTINPKASCLTDPAGFFRLKATHQFQYAYTEGGGLPDPKYWDDKVTISHTNYVIRQIDRWPIDKGTDKGDILLEPKK